MSRSLLVRVVARCSGLGLAAAALVGCEQPEVVVRPPNVVLLVIDTLRADYLGCYGFPEEISPGLDAIAAEGVRFENVFSQSSWTRPSMGSLLTSLYPREVGLYVEHEEILDDRFTTLAEAFQREGYTTLGFTSNPNINSTFNFHQGFDYYADSRVIFNWMEQSTDTVVRGKAQLASANELFGRALVLMEDAPADRPVYVQASIMEVHEWTPAGKVPKMLRPEYSEMLERGRWWRYKQLTRQATDDVGQFIANVRELPGWDDTLFVIVSDHGEGLGDHPDVYWSKHHGMSLYESQLRVPWILYRPGWEPAHSVVDQPVRLLEVMPTVLELAGIELAPGLQGRSLAPYLLGEGELPDVPSMRIAESSFNETEKIAVYGDAHKYIHSRIPHDGIDEFELQSAGGGENGAATNRIADEPETAELLREFLERWERDHPKVAPILGSPLSPEERSMLEQIGYLGDEEDQ